ncbi:MAG TPA: RES family NAD+ phosphorylase [Verrucomicrobiae bacterium]|nr:RES family NAD+ phosphorylase [Verrucomicrobiae bacterium]
MTLKGWRIVPEDKVATAFDGEGARLYGGRWNSVGVAMVYASQHKSLAALEVRVHIDTTRKIKRYQCLAFEFDESLMETFPIGSLPKNWRQEPPPPLLQQVGDAWIKAGRSAVLAVPSVIIDDELNYLLNPRHADFAKIKIEKPTDFGF